MTQVMCLSVLVCVCPCMYVRACICVCVCVLLRTKTFLFLLDYFQLRNQNLTCTLLCSSAGSSRHHVIGEHTQLFGNRKKSCDFFFFFKASCYTRVLIWAVCDGDLIYLIIRKKVAASTENSIFFSPLFTASG